MANKLQVKRSSVPGKVPTTTDLDLGEIAINTYDGKVYMKKNVSGVESIVLLTGAGAGDVTGPNSAANNSFARFDGITGKVIKNSPGASLSDAGVASFAGLSLTTTPLDIVSGGTGATTAGAALTSLGAQATLVSGTNIKTINGSSVLGSGNLVVEGVPAGAVVYFARNTAPTGYLKANGAAVSRSTYSALFSAIGTTFGAGDGSTTFNVPDLRGEFARGWDDGRGVDSGRTFGSSQAASQTWVAKNIGSACAVSYDQPSNAQTPSFDTTYTGGYLADTAYGVAKSYGSTATTNTLGLVRPRNIALLACIKY